MEDDKYSLELNVAVRVVHMACSLCQKVQKGLLSSTSFAQFKSKEDNSPVTIADWSVQAMVSWILSEIFGSQNISIVAEEDVQTLSKPESAGLLEMVVNTVNECLSEAPSFGLKSPAQALGPSQVLEAIGRCNAAGGPLGKHWVLDPIDGTLGFLRGSQYAIALALIDKSEVVIGVLGCPNYPAKRNWLVKHEQQSHAVPELSVTNPGIWEEGCILYTRRGSSEAWMQPLVQGDKKLVWPNSARLVRVSSIQDPALATFCEPVEEANSNHSFTAGLAQAVGLRKKPLRVHSMVKYAAIARGDAEIFMKFARAGYKEKIWDHAAGVLLVQEAGGVVTDAGGRPLDFSKGMYLEGLDRVILSTISNKLSHTESMQSGMVHETNVHLDAASLKIASPVASTVSPRVTLSMRRKRVCKLVAGNVLLSPTGIRTKFLAQFWTTIIGNPVRLRCILIVKLLVQVMSGQSILDLQSLLLFLCLSLSISTRFVSFSVLLQFCFIHDTSHHIIAVSRNPQILVNG